ncbi:phage tail tape measure C-terminal domain-containing protein [Klebsiella michiganensis]|uniref:phage tail tape measure C-terminal domain-containing protein n=1 Tax=Klebsiella michiganensis TaxID=1134687 RepID=UPI00226FDCD1|nr:phage tail tape measure C-terminal domain-containing protein [Klebsiella michiganensis]MCY0835588.1 phage tail tape measure protein [Klebsiella michiganensis]MDD7828629.1 phage tail tape measure C-terminal domain-containing protein [Klebsiella michiganensis]MDD7857451.1 phage tail tape measure C-terminal domain-containing protein [Klebsiella michiganensis]
MAGKSLGTLTIDLIAKVGGFVQGMDKAERSSQKWRDQVKKDAKEVGASIAAIGVAAATAAVGIGVAGLSIVKNTAQQVTEADRWAKSLKMSTQDLLSWQYAAEQAGLTGDNIADIFKDINDKVGDAVLNKSGEAAQALDTLGLSAEKLSKQSPDKQLMAISAALQKIPSQAGKTNILESLGNDLSKMLPLFDNNNEKLKQFIQLSKDFGVAPPQEDIDNLVKVNQFFQDIETSARGLKMEIASGLAKVDLSPLQAGLDDIRDVFTDPAVLQGISDLVGEAISLAGVVGRIAGGLGAIASYTRSRVGAVSGNYDASDMNDVEQRIEFLNKRGNQSKEQKEELDFLNKRRQFLQAIKGSILTPEESQRAAKGMQSLLSGMGIDPVIVDNNNLGKGESNQKQTVKKNPVDNAFQSRLLDLQKQAALIETTGKKTAEVTELEKINFDITSGNLKKLSEAQKEQLRTAAKTLDSKKEELRLNQENAKIAEYVSGLEKQNKLIRKGFDNQIVGRYSGSRERSRMQENNEIRVDFESRQEDLLNQLQSGDIDKSLYDKKKEALQSSLDERLKIQEEHYKSVDQLQKDGVAGFVSGISDQAAAYSDLYTNMSQVGAETFSNLTNMVITWAETGKLNAEEFAATFIQSVGAALLQYAAAQVAMAALSAFTAWIGVPYVGPTVASTQAIAAAAAAGVFMTAIGSALQGQAHDGIDSVPETGTWLLQKGERVTTAKTSAKLDATLERVSKDSTGGKLPDVHISTTVNGDPDQRTLLLLKETQKQAVQEALNLSANQIATGTGKIGKAMGSGWSTGRKLT